VEEEIFTDITHMFNIYGCYPEYIMKKIKINTSNYSMLKGTCGTEFECRLKPNFSNSRLGALLGLTCRCIYAIVHVHTNVPIMSLVDIEDVTNGHIEPEEKGYVHGNIGQFLRARSLYNIRGDVNEAFAMPLLLLNDGRCFFRATGELADNEEGILGKKLTEDYQEQIVLIK
jgi:hypothetical protein